MTLVSETGENTVQMLRLKGTEIQKSAELKEVSELKACRDVPIYKFICTVTGTVRVESEKTASRKF
jgi:hypothetical protein